MACRTCSGRRWRTRFMSSPGNDAINSGDMLIGGDRRQPKQYALVRNSDIPATPGLHDDHAAAFYNVPQNRANVCAMRYVELPRNRYENSGVMTRTVAYLPYSTQAALRTRPVAGQPLSRLPLYQQRRQLLDRQTSFQRYGATSARYQRASPAKTQQRNRTGNQQVAGHQWTHGTQL